MMLGGIEMARAEGDGEGGEYQRNPQRGVLPRGNLSDLNRHHDVRILRQDGEAARHRLQLQRNVRKNPDDRDHGHEPGEQRTLPVT
jgi:hypothetical protein